MQYPPTPTEQTVHPPSTPPPQAQRRPATLDDAMDLLTRLIQRTTRMETRLVRFMNAHGLDAEGDPLEPH